MRYQLQHLIGEGGQSSVYQALDTVTNELVAVKRYIDPPQPEANAWMQIFPLPEWLHPNLVRYLDCGRDDQGVFVVMELLGGKTLDRQIEEGPLRLPQFIDLVRHVLGGLAECHRHRVIHGDLKAENLMLCPWGEHSFVAKIFDFKLFELRPTAAQAGKKRDDRSITGSVFTIAPEQINRKKIDARTDLYSLGCLLYTAASGHHPFTGATNVAVIVAHLKHRVAPLRETAAKLSPTLCAWVMDLLAVNPHDRPRSAENALASFEKALAKA